MASQNYSPTFAVGEQKSGDHQFETSKTPINTGILKSYINIYQLVSLISELSTVSLDITCNISRSSSLAIFFAQGHPANSAAAVRSSKLPVFNSRYLEQNVPRRLGGQNGRTVTEQKWVFPKMVGVPPKIPQIINSNRVFPYKPSILGVSPYFWKHTSSIWIFLKLRTGYIAAQHFARI